MLVLTLLLSTSVEEAVVAAVLSAVSSTFDIEAEYLTKLKMNPKFKTVKNIKLKISNATVSQLSADTVFASVKNRKHECQRAIDTYLKNNRNITMVVSTLQADVFYLVEFDRAISINVKAKEDLLKDLSVELGASYNTDGAQSIAARGLFWGITADKMFVLIRDIEEMEMATIKGFSPYYSITIDRILDKERKEGLLEPSTVVYIEANSDNKQNL